MLRALTLFETHVQLRRSSYRLGLLLLMLAPLAALLIEHGRYATAFFGYGYLASVAFRLNLGMAEDQQTGHDLLMSNFASAWQRIAAKLCALAIREVLVLIFAALIAVLVWRDLRTGLWYTLEFTFIACLLLPIATAVELATRLRTPGALAILIAFVLLLVVVQASDPVTVFTRLGLPPSAGSFSALRRLCGFASVGVVLTFVFCGSWALARRGLRG